MTTAQLPRVLCVDDDAKLLEGLTPHLRRDYQFHTALGGEPALKILEQLGGVAVVVSDMRMPVMDGAVFLHRVAQLYPTTTRILLTGEPGRDGAVRAINEGQIFRFLTKPCPPQELKSAINAGIKQHELLTSERVLLQETLLGSIKALVDVLSLTNPVAFGRASRVKQLALTLAQQLERKEVWPLEAAALLSQVGYLALPAELVEKLYHGQRLTPDEQAMANGVPQVAKRVLGHIPRLEPVLHILDALSLSADARAKLHDDTGSSARILSVVLEYDALLVRGHTQEQAAEALRDRGAEFDQELVDRLVGSGITAEGDVREIPLRDVKQGMTLLTELRNERGALLVPRGFEVSATFLERMRNFGSKMLAEHVKVLVQPVKAA